MELEWRKSLEMEMEKTKQPVPFLGVRKGHEGGSFIFHCLSIILYIGSFMILNFYSRTLYIITFVHAAFVCFRPVLKVPSGRSYIILVTLTLWNRNLFWYFLVDQFSYMKIFSFYMLIFYLATLVNFFIVHSNLYCIFLHLWGYVF